jgi:hypothetical protein
MTFNNISKKLKKIAADKVPAEDVQPKKPYKPEKEEQDSISLLKSCSDDFVLLMRTIDDSEDLKITILGLYPLIYKFNTKILEASNGLKKVLNDNEKAEGSELNAFVNSLETVSKEMLPYIELCSTLKDLTNKGSAKIEKEKKHKPVEHKLPKKKIEPKEESK